MPTKVKGCRNCSRRRINCDRTQPHCLKCVRDNLECYGLTGTYRWVAGSSARKNRQGSQALPLSASKLPQTKPEDTRDADCDLTSSFNLLHEVPRTKEDEWVANYFAEQITPWTCPILRCDNECRTLILPLALTSPLVFDALAAASFHRLAYYGNSDFTIKAERYKASAIKGLLKSCRNVCSPSGSSDDRLFAAATLLILMYDEMIAAQDYFTTLVRIMDRMRNFVDFSTIGGSSELQAYLFEQFGFLTMFALPHVDEDIAIELQQHSFQFLDKVHRETMTESRSLNFLVYCWRTLLTIWQKQKLNPGFNADSKLEEFRFRVESNEQIGQVDHYLTWVYFMASAASSDLSLRKFFMDRLFAHTVTFGWKNVAMMHGFLESLQQVGSAWPSHLQSHKKYICA